MILWCSVRYSLIRSWTATSKSSAFSRISAASQKASATIAFSVVFGLPIESADPTIRNSNLFPVNAKGEVLFLSVASFSKSGSVDTPVASLPPCNTWAASPVSTSCFTTSSSCSPRKIEMIAGGASFAPSLWSFPTSDALWRSRSAWTSTALIMQASTSRNWIFSFGVSPGSRRFTPLSVPSDQLLCLPEPLTPAKGFSWSRQVSPWRPATFFMVSITSWLWSTAIFAVS